MSRPANPAAPVTRINRLRASRGLAAILIDGPVDFSETPKVNGVPIGGDVSAGSGSAPLRRSGTLRGYTGFTPGSHAIASLDFSANQYYGSANVWKLVINGVDCLQLGSSSLAPPATIDNPPSGWTYVAGGGYGFPATLTKDAVGSGDSVECLWNTTLPVITAFTDGDGTTAAVATFDFAGTVGPWRLIVDGVNYDQTGDGALNLPPGWTYSTGYLSAPDTAPGHTVAIVPVPGGPATVTFTDGAPAASTGAISEIELIAADGVKKVKCIPGAARITGSATFTVQLALKHAGIYFPLAPDITPGAVPQFFAPINDAQDAAWQDGYSAGESLVLRITGTIPADGSTATGRVLAEQN